MAGSSAACCVYSFYFIAVFDGNTCKRGTQRGAVMLLISSSVVILSLFALKVNTYLTHPVKNSEKQKAPAAFGRVVFQTLVVIVFLITYRKQNKQLTWTSNT